MKKFFLLLTLMAATFIGTSAQQVVIKNNLLYDATSTPNLSLEFGLNKKQTFDVQVGFNPFDLDKQANKKFKHIAIQPEWRYWTCERFNGLFFGIHAHAGRFNVSNMKFPGGILHTLEKNRYEVGLSEPVSVWVTNSCSTVAGVSSRSGRRLRLFGLR